MGYLRERGVKGFVAMNILVFDEELADVEDRARVMAEAGVDAVIVQVCDTNLYFIFGLSDNEIMSLSISPLTSKDLGVVDIIRRVAPNLPVHGSTQMTITSPEGAAFVAGLGVDRVVVGRELSVKEIAKVG